LAALHRLIQRLSDQMHPWPLCAQVTSRRIDDASSPAGVLQTLCERASFRAEAAAELHKQLFKQKLLQLVGSWGARACTWVGLVGWRWRRGVRLGAAGVVRPPPKPLPLPHTHRVLPPCRPQVSKRKLTEQDDAELTRVRRILCIPDAVANAVVKNTAGGAGLAWGWGGAFVGVGRGVCDSGAELL